MLGRSDVRHCWIKVDRYVIVVLSLLRQYFILIKVTIAVLSDSLLYRLNLTATLHEDIAISRRLEVALLR